MKQQLIQILVLDGEIDEGNFSSALNTNIASFKNVYPHAEHKLYTDQDIQDFLRDSFPADVLETYRALIPNAYKADLARYCLLYHMGGFYSDLSYLHLVPVELSDEQRLVVFRDIEGHPPWATSNGVIFAQKGLAVFDRAINRILQHRKSGYLGLSALDPTGPYLFGRVLAEADDWQTTTFGDSTLIARDENGRASIVKRLPDKGQIIAIRNKQKDSQISDLVGVKGESYAALWDKGRVWRDHQPKGFWGAVSRQFQ